MNSIRSVIIICLVWLSITSVQAQWAFLGSQGFNGTRPRDMNIKVNSNDVPYVVMNHSQTAHGVVMYYSGSSWDTLGTPFYDSGGTRDVMLSISSKDSVYVVFQDSDDKLSVKKYNGSSWVYVGNKGISDAIADDLHISHDNNDTPYIAFTDNAQSDAITVMKFNGSSWVVVGSKGFTSSGSAYGTLAFDSNNDLYIAYYDGGNSNKATVRKYTGSSWDTVGSAGFTPADAREIKLAIGKNDTLYVAYSDWNATWALSVMKYNGSSWANVGSAGFSTTSAENVHFDINSKNELYVSHREYYNNQRTTFYTYNGSSWVTVDTLGITPAKATYPTFDFDSDDNIYLAFGDYASSGRQASVMKYTIPANVWNGTTWSDGTPDSTTKVSIESNTTPTTFTCADLFIDTGFSLNTGTNEVITVYGNITNNGNGITGTGTITFTKDGTAELKGDTLEHEGTITVESNCTLNTNNILRLISDATNTGRIGNSAGTISGNVMVQRYMPGKRCFRFYGHPFSSSIALSQLTNEVDITGSGGAANGFTTTSTNNPSAFWFDVTAADTSTTGANPGWTAFTSANTASWDRYELLRLLVRGAKGEGLTGGSYTPSAATFEGAGEVNQGTQVITLTKGSNTTFAGCGNPFPSPVQMNTVAVGSNVGANYYAWDATSGVAGAYVTNPWATSYVLPAYAAFFTTVSANTNNTLTFEEADKDTTSNSLFKGTANNYYVELLISDSTTKWDRLLIGFDNNAMAVEDNLDGKKLYNPGLDFFTRSKDDVRLAVDVRPYKDAESIPLGLTAYNRYNKYVIKTGMFDVPAGAQLYLHDKYLNKKVQLNTGVEYWFDVTSDTASQGNHRFEINMVGKTASILSANDNTPVMQLIPNPAHKEVKVSFKALTGSAQLTLTSVTGQTVLNKKVKTATGSAIIQLENIPAGMYIVELKGENASLTQKLIKE